MSNIKVTRSVKFVSVDTHPANNALVVTYEILATVVDRLSNRELAGRSKRHQIQISLSALDKLNAGKEPESNKLTVNIQQIANEILNKCPLLTAGANRSKNLEDIQLHLLYLVSRRQSQLIAEQQSELEPNRKSQSTARMRSAARLGSAASNRRLGSSGSSSASSSATTGNEYLENVYSYLQARSLSQTNPNHAELFLAELDEHLEESASAWRESDKTKPVKLDELDLYLEGLYGDHDERLASMLNIRELMRDEANLEAISSNRLLVCAIIRTLRDLNQSNHQKHYLLLCESIFYTLIRFTLFEEVFESLFEEQSDERASSLEGSVDLVKLVTEFMSENVNKTLVDLRKIFEYYYYTNSLLIISLNLFQISRNSSLEDDSAIKISSYKTEQKILQQQDQMNRKRLLESLVRLFCLQVKFLKAQEVSMISRPQQIFWSLSRIVEILKKLSIFKEFSVQLRSIMSRNKDEQFIGALMSLVNTLQLTRPGSGANNNTKPTALLTDRQILNSVYELEINTLTFINNILYDLRIRSKLIAKNLLKSVLRNLVVFLAAKSNFLSSYNRSIVLMVPFKCLYELSCDSIIRAELFKSKIIMKCLLEYLLSCCMEFKTNLDLLASTPTATSVHQKEPTGDAHLQEQIFMEPKQASHYILGIWLNLSAQREAPIYGSDAELREVVGEYLEMTIGGSLKVFVALESRGKELVQEEHQLMMYLELKLARNISQFVGTFQAGSSGELGGGGLDKNQSAGLLGSGESFRAWLEQLDESCGRLMGSRRLRMADPISVECLAIIANLLLNSQASLFDVAGERSRLLSSLVGKIFSGPRYASLEGENDDLLLVSVTLLGVLARRLELCQLEGDCSYVIQKALQISNFVLEARTTDSELITHTLHAFLGLTNHAQLLKKLAGELESEPVERLLASLSQLMSSADGKLSRLAVSLLNRLAQLEEQVSIEESLIKRKRFELHNSKWLTATRQQNNNRRPEEMGSEKRFLEEEEQLYQLEADEEAFLQREFLAVASSEERAAGSPATNGGKLSDLDSIEEDDLVSDDEVESSFTNEPDLNVIDQNSMIKHLTSRRHFRSLELMRR